MHREDTTMSTDVSTFFLSDALIEQAIADFVEESERQLATLKRVPARQRTPAEREGITELARDIKAYERVSEYWAARIYPRCIDGDWQIASLSERGTVHHIWRSGERWACDCKTAHHGCFHVHQAMMAVIERALDLAEQYDETPAAPEPPIHPDDYEPEPDIVGDDIFLPTPAQLGRRLAEARSKYLTAA